MRDIGKNIRDLRQQKGLTQEELAGLLYVTRQTVSNYENGKSRPDVEMIAKIAEVLGCDANTVFYGPPVAEDRRRDYAKAALAAALLAVFGILLPRLHRAASVFASLNFVPGPVMLIYLLYPIWWFSVGWGIVFILGILLRVRRPDHRAFEIGRRILAAAAILYLLLVLPYSIWCIGQIYGHLHSCDNPVGLLQRWDAYNDIIWWLLEPHWEHSTIYLLPGLLLGLCRLPAGKKKE